MLAGMLADMLSGMLFFFGGYAANLWRSWVKRKPGSNETSGLKICVRVCCR